MYSVKLKFALVLLLFSFILPQAFSVYAGGIAPKEDFTITPKEGRYRYPEDVRLRKGEEYIVIGETEDSYVIKYELVKGIFLDIHVPRDKVEYMEKTKSEQFEEEQKAKGLVKIGNYWVTKENAALRSQFVDLKRLRDETLELEKSNEKEEAALATGYEDIARLNDYIISLQQKAGSLGEWLEKHKVTKSSPADEIKKYNSKVIEYNKLGRDISRTASEIKRTQMYCERKNKRIRYGIDRYQTKKSEYMRKFSKFEDALMNSLSNAQGEQRIFLSSIAEEIRLLSRELTYSIIQARRYSDGAFVKGIINDKLDAMFIVDTGATYVTISKSMAEQLQLDITSNTPRENLRLADGSIRNLPVIILPSISLGEIRQNKVKAAVAEDSPGFTPLLGTSFLKYFNWHFEGNKIVFKKWEFGNIKQEK